MSLAGFKKQLNKANQLISEKIGGAKGTELDNEFVEYERKLDSSGKLIEEMITRTQEYLQPNPATRAKLMTMNTLHKLQGKGKSSLYPQPEGLLGECLVKYGKELSGKEAFFSECIVATGESFKQLADIKYQLEDNVKQNFLEPFHEIQIRDLKEINHHRIKMKGRRLDYDCKKRKQDKGATISTASASGSKVPDDEIKVAEEKFIESRNLAEVAMLNFLNSDVEHINALQEFIVSELEYHRKAADIMEELQSVIFEKRKEAEKKPKALPMPKRSVSNRSLNTAGLEGGESSSFAKNGTAEAQNLFNQSGGANDATGTAANSHQNAAKRTPTARALFDFDIETEMELGFKEGDTIRLIQQVDTNWFEGELNGKTGYFPINYVEVLVPLEN